jgi:hypothetical protein
MVNQWQGGLTGVDIEREDADIKNIKRLDDEWPVDEWGAKVSLPPTVASTINRMPPGTITQSRGYNDPGEDPAVSQRQYRAMQAAAHGHSNLGISRDVGKEFADATPHPGSLPERKR